MTYRLDLPFTRPPILENTRLHWAPRARLTADLRQTAHYLAKAAQLPQGLGMVEITLHWQPAVRRGRDLWGPSPTLKALVDGLVTDYGLCADDTIRHVRPACVVYEWQRGVPGACWLTIKEEAT